MRARSGIGKRDRDGNIPPAGVNDLGVIDVLVLSSEDWQLWRELRRAALAESPAAFGSTLEQWSGAGDTEQRWRARLESVALNLVLRVYGEPAGMVSATAPTSEGTVELISMWVAPTARGRGVGDEAIDRVLTWAHSEFRGTRVALSVKPGNQPARRLYRRHGFTDAGPSPDDPDELLMHHRGIVVRVL
jgi:RimJ/RimL family protein N-acetyltransferase